MARRSYGGSPTTPASVPKEPVRVSVEPELKSELKKEIVEENSDESIVQESASVTPSKKKRRTYGATSVSKPVLSEDVQVIDKPEKTAQKASETLTEAESSKKQPKPKKVKEKKVLTPKQKRKRTVLVTVSLIFLIVAGYFGYRAFMWYEKDAKIQAMWDAIRDEACVDDGDGITGEDGYSKDPFDREIDWDALFAINKDVKCWIYIPGTNIDYPVLQEQESSNTFFYLNHDIYKNYNYMGCILCCKEPDGYEDKDAHLTFYGHKMLGKQMFGNLDLYKNADFYAENSYVYVYYPDRTERWSVWSAFHTTKDDMIYEMPYEIGTNGYLDLINHIDSSKLYKTQSGTPDELENTLTLSTCDNPRGGHDGRFTVSCRIVNRKKDIKWFNTEAQTEDEKKHNDIINENQAEKQKKLQEENERGEYYDTYTIEYNGDEE